jgi:hypothetical protein
MAAQIVVQSLARAQHREVEATSDREAHRDEEQRQAHIVAVAAHRRQAHTAVAVAAHRHRRVVAEAAVAAVVQHHHADKRVSTI